MSSDTLSRRKALAFALSMGAALGLAEALKPRRTAQGGDADLRLEDVFPSRIGHWSLDETQRPFIRPADEQGKLYGIYDAVLERTYFNAHGSSVMLCVAYGRDQSPALQVHRPEVCYAASGFDIHGVQQDALGLDARFLPVTRLHATMLGRSEPITYWTVLGDEVVGSRQAFQWRQLQSGLRQRSVDGMLVRISSIQRERRAAYLVHDRFAKDLHSSMQDKHRNRVFGASAKSG